jgi:hypothetical protein
VTLEVLDAGGKLVRRFSSEDKPEATPDELAKQLIPLYWLKMPKTLPAAAGMHRWIWDLRYATPTATRYEYPISAVPHATPRTPQGALALPGAYQVRLIADGKVITAPLTVKIDPRVAATRAELEAEFKLESQLSGMVSNSAEAALEAHSIREQIAQSEKVAPAELKQSLQKQDKAFAALLAGEPKPGGGEGEPGLDEVAGEAEGLYGQVGQADAAPTMAQTKASQHLNAEMEEVLNKWQKLKATAIPALNHQLSQAHLPTLRPEQRPETMPESGDED